MKTRFAILAVAGVIAVALTGCEGSKKTAAADTKTAKPAAMGVMNTKCPYSGNAVKEGATADFGGQKVGFCCNGCAGKFAKMDDAGKQALMAKAPK